MSELKEYGEIARVAVITGGASGIGKATAERFSREGIIPVIADLDHDRAAEVADSLGGMAVKLDVTDYDDCKRAADEVFARYGHIDILVCCAGGSSARILNQPGNFADIDISRVRFGIELNLMGAINCCHVVIKRMISAGYGRIIFLGSAAGIVGAAGGVDYSASKGGLMSFTKSLAMEVGKQGLRVNIVSPGPIMTRPGMASGNTFLGRCGEPEEVASMINYLVSDEASFLTGQNFIVDGGRTLGGLPYGDWFKKH